jgi:hypothetical protein
VLQEISLKIFLWGRENKKNQSKSNK